MKYLLVLSLLLSVNLYAEELSVESYLDRDSLALGETLKDTILVKGDFKTTLTLDVPEFRDFNILSNRKMSRVNISAGEVVSSVEFIFVLSSIKEGSLEMSGFKIKTKDIERDIESVKVDVIRGEEEALSGKREDNLDSNTEGV